MNWGREEEKGGLVMGREGRREGVGGGWGNWEGVGLVRGWGQGWMEGGREGGRMLTVGGWCFFVVMLSVFFFKMGQTMLRKALLKSPHR